MESTWPAVTIGKRIFAALCLAMAITVWAAPALAQPATTISYAGRDILLLLPNTLPPPGRRALVVVLHGGMGNAALEEAERRALGERIDRLRHAKRLTLAELAQKAGYDERTARNIISGRPTRYKTLLNFCEAIGISSIESKSDVAAYSR